MHGVMQGDHPNWAEYRAEDRAAMVSDQRLVARLTLTYCYGILPSGGGDGAFGLRGICTPTYGCIYVCANGEPLAPLRYRILGSYYFDPGNYEMEVNRM